MHSLRDERGSLDEAVYFTLEEEEILNPIEIAA